MLDETITLKSREAFAEPFSDKHVLSRVLETAPGIKCLQLRNKEQTSDPEYLYKLIPGTHVLILSPIRK